MQTLSIKKYLVTMKMDDTLHAVSSQISNDVVIVFVMGRLNSIYKGLIIMTQLVPFKSFNTLHSAFLFKEDIIGRANETHDELAAFYKSCEKGKDNRCKGKSSKGVMTL